MDRIGTCLQLVVWLYFVIGKGEATSNQINLRLCLFVDVLWCGAVWVWYGVVWVWVVVRCGMVLRC
jgi:hypothetical protein